MSYKILTKNGVENTNIEHARDFNFNSGGRSGIIKGVLNECNITSGASNVVTIDTCELRLCGHRIVIEDAEYLTLSNNPAQAIRYSIIAEIRVADSVPSFKLFYQLTSSTLTKDNLSAHVLGNGTYQLELGRFTLNTDGTISDIVRTADLIVGGGYSIDGGLINIGNITTNTLDAGMEAEVDIEERYDSEQDKIFTDFTFSVPKGDKGDQGIQGIQGPQGEKGEQGEKGDTGATNKLTIGTVTSGTSASASISGTAPNQVLNLVLPKGEQGEQGVQGPQGPQGAGVTVNGESTAVNFTSDPQTQLDNKLSLSGGTMTGDIRLPSGKFIVDDSGYGLVGYYGTSSATFGNPNRKINLRGTETRPQYNSLDVAMYSDLSNFANKDLSNVTTSILRSKVIYDMTSPDSELNWGYTSGIQGSATKIDVSSKNLSSYKKLMIYVSLNGNSHCFYIDLEEDDENELNGGAIFPNYSGTAGLYAEARVYNFTEFKLYVGNFSNGKTAKNETYGYFCYKIEGVY